jgi:hypothetical protein
MIMSHIACRAGQRGTLFLLDRRYFLSTSLLGRSANRSKGIIVLGGRCHSKCICCWMMVVAYDDDDDDTKTAGENLDDRIG